MRYSDTIKHSDLLRGLYAMRQTGRFPSIEAEKENLWLEVTGLLSSSVLFSEAPIGKAKILIFQDWDKMSLAYRLGSDDKSLVRQFSLQYNPNRIRDLKDRAVRNGYRTKYSPPDDQYKNGLLEIELELFWVGTLKRKNNASH